MVDVCWKREYTRGAVMMLWSGVLVMELELVGSCAGARGGVALWVLVLLLVWTPSSPLCSLLVLALWSLVLMLVR